jgi:hypothetical protein
MIAPMTRTQALPGGPARLVVAVLALALAAGACGTAAPTPSPAAPTTSAAPSASATLSPSGAASPAASGSLDALFTRIEGQVSALRGLKATSPVARNILDEAGLKALVARRFAEDSPAALVTATERSYKALGLLAAGASLGDLYVGLMSSQAIGVYDEKTKQMYVVAPSGTIGPVEEITYAHEYTHALQDQAFGLKSIVGDVTDQGDRTLARRMLVEGDATLLMTLWARANLAAAELAQVAGASTPASQAVLDRTPAIIKEPLLAQYTSGLTLVLGAYGAGQYAAVDRLFANPPDSTAQVLHPDKLAARPKPVAVTIPTDLATRLGTGWSIGLQDTLGELQLGILLRDGGGVDQATASTAAAGWAGDRVAWLEGPGGANAAVLDTVWDTPGDGMEFAVAGASVVAKLRATGRSAAVLTPGPGRVVVISASNDVTLARISAALGLAG